MPFLVLHILRSFQCWTTVSESFFQKSFRKPHHRYFATYQWLHLNPRTYNTRSLETMTMAENLKTSHRYKFIPRTMLRYQRISVAFFSFKNPLKDKLLVAGCTRFSKLYFSRLCSGFFSFCNSKQLCNAKQRYKCCGRVFLITSIE